MQNTSYIVHAAINKHYYLAYLRKKLLFMYKEHLEIALSNNKLISFQQEEWQPYQSLINSI